MKPLLLLLLVTLSVPLFSQKGLELSEQNFAFSSGAKNSIVVQVPYGNQSIVDQVLQKELKSWNGKLKSSSGEYFLSQASGKFMGGKPFDVYAKSILSDGQMIAVAFAVDLGGAFLNSTDHPTQFLAMQAKVKQFAVDAAQKCIEAELDIEEDRLKELQKEFKRLEKKKQSDLASISKYKRKIADTEKRIEQCEKDQISKKADIDAQQGKIKSVEKKKKEIRK